MDPEQTAPIGAVYRSSLIWVHTVCLRGFLNISVDEKSRRTFVAIGALRVKVVKNDQKPGRASGLHAEGRGSDKCNTLQVTRSRNPLTFNVILKGQDLKDVNTAKYIGVDLSSNISWNSHIDQTTKKTNSML